MKRLSSLLLATFVLASCNNEEQSKQSNEVEQGQNEDVNVKQEIDEDYEKFLEHHTAEELEAVKVTGEKLMQVYFSKLDESLYSEVKDDLIVGAQNEFENFTGVLDPNKVYKVQSIKYDYIQGFDAPEVHMLYTVDYVEIDQGKKSEVKTYEFVITALDWKDKEGLAISKFENKTVLDENSLFN